MLFVFVFVSPDDESPYFYSIPISISRIIDHIEPEQYLNVILEQLWAFVSYNVGELQLPSQKLA